MHFALFPKTVENVAVRSLLYSGAVKLASLPFANITVAKLARPEGTAARITAFPKTTDQDSQI